MSLTGALSSAISALNSQSQSLAMISDNISNADTTGYKTTSAMFEDLVTASNSATSYTSGGVTVSGRANITQQGLLAATTNATDVAIQGSGFFVTTQCDDRRHHLLYAQRRVHHRQLGLSRQQRKLSRGLAHRRARQHHRQCFRRESRAGQHAGRLHQRQRDHQDHGRGESAGRCRHWRDVQQLDDGLRFAWYGEHDPDRLEEDRRQCLAGELRAAEARVGLQHGQCQRDHRYGGDHLQSRRFARLDGADSADHLDHRLEGRRRPTAPLPMVPRSRSISARPARPTVSRNIRRARPRLPSTSRASRRTACLTAS
ncbi:hypothetical protein ACVWY2_003188 [Bradyrhizobium sp. JR6.1]